MNSSETSQTERAVHGCGLTSQRTVDHTSSEVYGWLVFITVINIITCPITAVLNVLIMIAVKTNNQVRTKSNIALACLSSTDAVMGVIGQPLFIGWLIEELQGNTSGTYCVLIGFARVVLTLVLGIASLFHLAMMYVERYTAIKHSLRYEIIVTEARLIGVSALLWTIPLLSKFFTSSNYVKFDIGLRWPDWIFLGGYLPSLSLNYVGMCKDMEQRLPQLYYIKIKIGNDLGFIAIGVDMAT